MLFQRGLKLRGILLGFLSLAFIASFAIGQTDIVGNPNTKQTPPSSETDTVAPTVDPALMAQFDVRIQQIKQDAENQVAELQSALQSRTGSEQETYLRQIEDVKKNAQISILEVRREQELARGNTEMAAKFQQAADMLRNPTPRQEPNQQADQNRFDQHRSTSETTTR
jgi:Skp family chaperone for outer membrane proteins